MKEIHVWEFHPTKTQIKLKDGFRKTFFDELYKKYGYEQASDSIAKLAKQYKIRKIQNRTDFYTWKKGYTTKNGKIKQRNMPLWALIELSKLLSNNNNANNVVMKKIEKNIEYYAASGKGKKLKETKFPIRLTPELTSIIFHLCGDGHIGLNECCSHYRQMNPVGLNNFLNKLVNIFGKFEISKNEFEDGKIIIPKVITDFYQHYFKLNSCYWDVARIPQQLKNLPKPFLVAGLCSFIIDEGHIGDVIEIYSGNTRLLEDIKEIALKLSYICWGPKKKFRYGKLDSFRIYISTNSAIQFYRDIKQVTKAYPTCGLAQKQKLLETIIKRKERKINKTADGVAKNKINKMLIKHAMTVSEIAEKLSIGHTSMREHLQRLNQLGIVERIGKKGKHADLWSKVR